MYYVPYDLYIQLTSSAHTHEPSSAHPTILVVATDIESTHNEMKI